MSTLSPRWGFTLPDPLDNVSITDLNNDLQKIDNGLGFTPCTNSTRPSAPVNGQAIYEADTHNSYVWDAPATTWRAVSSGTSSGGGGGGSGTAVTVDGVSVGTLALDSTPAAFNDLSDSGTLRAMLFGGSARTQKAFFAARLTANLSVANNATTLIPNSSLTVAKDTDAGWSTTNSTYTIPVTGFYRARLFPLYASNATGDRYTNITLNSTDTTVGSIGEEGTGGSASYNAYHKVSVEDQVLSATDVLRFYVYQNSGAALNLLANVSGRVSTAITVEWIRPA